MTRGNLNPPRIPTITAHMATVRQGARDIREESAGRVCGTCEHYARAFCACPRNYVTKHSAPLRIYRETAVACRRWEPAR